MVGYSVFVPDFEEVVFELSQVKCLHCTQMMLCFCDGVD